MVRSRSTRRLGGTRRTVRFECLEERALLAADLLITEFMAANDKTLFDGDGDTPDWIEIHNPSGVPQDLTGWYLTDNVGKLTKWTFPAAPVAQPASESTCGSVTSLGDSEQPLAHTPCTWG